MWISHPLGHKAGLFQFKKAFHLDAIPEKAEIRLSADTKYRLYINDQYVQLGPAKRSEFYSFYDTVNILPFIKEGKNEISVYVLHLDPVGLKAGRGHVETMLTGPLACLGADILMDEQHIITDTSWLVAEITEFEILPPFARSMAGIFQKVDYNNFSREFVPAVAATPLNIELTDEHPDNIYNPCGETLYYRLIASPIPPLTYKEGGFVNFKSFSGKNTAVVLNAGVHSTAAVRFKVSGTKGTKITLTYSETFWQKDGNGNYYRGIRDDESGFIIGSEDQIILDGNEHTFETFFWQCFRFIEVKIEGEATLSDIKLFKMRYPLNCEADFISSDKDSKAMWEVSIRTLNNCMHDSFEDCPYYEQLQYVMDSRLQAIFLRQLTDDRRLIIKCINDFNEGRFPDGMVPARTPSLRKQRIPGFGLHYIYMLHDHMLYERDKERIADLLPVADGILRYFEKREMNGIVGPLGKWNYIDWVSGWDSGVPTHTGGISIYSFMLTVAYENAAEMAEFTGRHSLAEEYKKKAKALRIRAKEYFYDSDKQMFMDSDDKKRMFSLHAQIWAVLADAVTGDEATDLLQRAYEDKTISVCSYSMMFFVFRAYEKAGLYNLAYNMLDEWRKMLKMRCTTWIESAVGNRSDCHAWSALPIYEFSACILGVKVTMDGMIVKPYVHANDSASGTVMTPIGKILVDWKKENGTFTLKVNAPENVKIILPDGSEYFESDIVISCKV